MKNIQNNYCIKSCQFLEMVDTDFNCSYFNEVLKITVSPSKSSLRPLRCDECNQAGDEITKKMAFGIIKHHLGVIEGNIKYLVDVISELDDEKKR